MELLKRNRDGTYGAAPPATVGWFEGFWEAFRGAMKMSVVFGVALSPAFLVFGWRGFLLALVLMQPVMLLIWLLGSALMLGIFWAIDD